LLAVAICLATAGTALAAKHKVVVRSYKGTTGQINPSTHKHFTLSFTLTNTMVSSIRTTVRDTCPDGTSLRVNENAFKSVKLDSKGRFTLRAGPPQQPAVIKGKVTGSTASGTITDKSNDTAGSGLCKGSTTWTATRQPAK
jgi:hypothetical protein